MEAPIRYFAVSVMYFKQRHHLLGAFGGYPSAPDIMLLLKESLNLKTVSMGAIDDFAVSEIGKLDFEAASAAFSKNKKEYEKNS